MAVLTYKCPNCGGPLHWDGNKGKFSCEYCGSGFTETELAALAPAQSSAQEVEGAEAEAVAAGPANGESAMDFSTEDPSQGKQTAQAASQPAKIRRYNCPSCGAQIVTDDTTSATTCYYCHNPIVLMDKFDGSFNPDFVIPFAIDREKAKGIFKDWVKQHKYIPRDFYSEKQIGLLSGVYFPYWVYQAKISGVAKGQGNRTKEWDSGGMRHVETEVYRIDKKGDMEINDLSRIALSKASKVLCESVMPFELDKMKKFSPGYLQGYIAESRDIEKETLAPQIRQEVDNYAMERLRESASEGFSSVELSDVATRVEKENYLYALMPVWTLTYKGNDGKIYYFSINGQTGKTVGELPTDQRSLLFLFLKVFLPMFIALLALFRFVV